MRNESNRLYGCHGPEPVDTCRTGQTGHEVRILRAGEVRDEAAVSYHERRGFDAPFDANQQRTHRAAVTDAQVGYAFIVDVGLCAQHIDGALQILDQLDLLGPIFSGEPDWRSAAASKRGIDRNYYCAVLREQLAEGRHTACSAGHTVHEQDAGAQTGAGDRIEQQSGYRSAVRTAEGDGADLHAIVRGFDRLLQVQWRIDVVSEEGSLCCGRHAEIRTCDRTGIDGGQPGRGPCAGGNEHGGKHNGRFHRRSPTKFIDMSSAYAAVV